MALCWSGILLESINLFIHYNTESQHQSFLCACFLWTQFYCILMDGSTVIYYSGWTGVSSVLYTRSICLREKIMHQIFVFVGANKRPDNILDCASILGVVCQTCWWRNPWCINQCCWGKWHEREAIKRASLATLGMVLCPLPWAGMVWHPRIKYVYLEDVAPLLCCWTIKLAARTGTKNVLVTLST